MRLVRRVRSGVVEHRIKRGCQGLELYNTGEHRAIANFRVDDECRALGDLERMKFCGRCANALLDLGRTRALEQLFFVNLAGASSNLGGNFPIAHLFPFAQRGVKTAQGERDHRQNQSPWRLRPRSSVRAIPEDWDRTNRC